MYSTDEYRGVDFGFRDAIAITGDLCFSSILKFRAANELREIIKLLHDQGRSAKYTEIAGKIRKAIPGLFLDARGILLASTGISKQPDVWASALVVYLGVVDEDAQKKTCQFLADAYKKGTLSYNGNIRHILTIDDYN